ncbi:MFS transporter [Microbacterium saperdae]
MTSDLERGDSRAALWCCLGAGFSTLLDATVVAYTAPAVAETLGASAGGVQWFLAAYSLTFGLGLVPAGRLGDAYGRRGLFVAGLVIFLLGAVASAVAPDVALLIAGRLAQGIGAGFISAQVLGVIQDLFDGTARIKAFGAYTATGAVAAVAGPLLAGALLWFLPPDPAWRLVLLLPVPFTLVTIVLGLRGLPRRPRVRPTAGLDIPGILLLGGLVVIVTLPVIDPGMPAPVIIAIVVSAAALTAVLVLWERRYGRRGRLPLFVPALMRSRGFVVGNAVALLWFGSILATSTVVTIYFLQAQGVPALVVAASLIPSSLARLLGSRTSAPLFQRLGTRLLTYGLILHVGCLLLIVLATVVWQSWALFIAVMVVEVILGLSGGVVEPPMRAVILGFSPRGFNGVAASFLQLTQRLSATFFIALASGVLLGFGGTISPESLRIALVICIVAAGSATFCSLHPALRGHALSPEVSDFQGRRSPVMHAGKVREVWKATEVDWFDERAERLRAAMDEELDGRYADLFQNAEPERLAKFAIDFALDPATIVATVIVVDDAGEPVGHAALRRLGEDLEVKRVFVAKFARGTGVSRALMAELERIALRLGATRLILQTGDRQQDAVTLYTRIGYSPIPVFAPYADFELSLCFEKLLVAAGA